MAYKLNNIYKFQENHLNYISIMSSDEIYLSYEKIHAISLIMVSNMLYARLE